jgi:hypothetical protein
MRPLGDPLRGTTSDIEHPQSFLLHLVAGHCYRAYVVSEATLRDVDIRVRTPDGVVQAQDVSDTNLAVLPESGVLCMSKESAATLDVAAGSGSGAFAAQVWSD